MKKIGEMDISDRMKLRIIVKEINESRKRYIRELKGSDPKAYSILRRSQKKDLERFRKKNPGYRKNWRKKKSGK